LRLSRSAQNPWYEVRLIEGRQNQVRLMFKHYGLLVEKLKRTRIGFLELGSLRPGTVRHLTTKEVERFRRLVEAEHT
jgi:23S rRNA pseudouridine2605 synthase